MSGIEVGPLTRPADVQQLLQTDREVHCVTASSFNAEALIRTWVRLIVPHRPDSSVGCVTTSERARRVRSA